MVRKHLHRIFNALKLVKDTKISQCTVCGSKNLETIEGQTYCRDCGIVLT